MGIEYSDGWKAEAQRSRPSGKWKMIGRDEISRSYRHNETYEHYELSGIGARLFGSKAGYLRAYGDSIRHADEILFALALTVLILGSVFSMDLMARMGALQ